MLLLSTLVVSALMSGWEEVKQVVQRIKGRREDAGDALREGENSWRVDMFQHFP